MIEELLQFFISEIDTQLFETVELFGGIRTIVIIDDFGEGSGGQMIHFFHMVFMKDEGDGGKVKWLWLYTNINTEREREFS